MTREEAKLQVTDRVLRLKAPTCRRLIRTLNALARVESVQAHNTVFQRRLSANRFFPAASLGSMVLIDVLRGFTALTPFLAVSAVIAFYYGWRVWWPLRREEGYLATRQRVCAQLHAKAQHAPGTLEGLPEHSQDAATIQQKGPEPSCNDLELIIDVHYEVTAWNERYPKNEVEDTLWISDRYQKSSPILSGAWTPYGADL